MTAKRASDKLLSDVVRLYTDLFSDGNYRANKKFVQGVFDSMKLVIADCAPGQRLTITGLGVFEVRPPKKMTGSFKHYRTNAIISKVQEFPRLRFLPSNQLKGMMRKKHAKRNQETLSVS